MTNHQEHNLRSDRDNQSPSPANSTSATDTRTKTPATSDAISTETTTPTTRPRDYFIDWLRLLCLIGITIAHLVPQETVHPIVYWLSNSIAPLLFAAIIGITTHYSSKSNAQVVTYAALLFMLGVSMTMTGNLIIPVLQTLALCMIVARIIPQRLSSVIIIWLAYLAGSYLVWNLTTYSAGQQCFTVGYCDLPHGLQGLLFNGTYSVLAWVPVTVTAGWLYSHRHIAMTSAVVALPAIIYHIYLFSRLDGSVAFTKSMKVSYLFAMMTPYAHTNSIMSGVAALSIFMVLIGLSTKVRLPKAPALASMSLTGYMIGWLFFFVESHSWLLFILATITMVGVTEGTRAVCRATGAREYGAVEYILTALSSLAPGDEDKEKVVDPVEWVVEDSGNDKEHERADARERADERADDSERSIT